MKPTVTCTWFVVASLCLLPVGPASGQANGEAHRLAVEELDRFTRGLVDADRFSGAVLFAHGDEVLYRAAFGLANRDFEAPNRIDTKFNLGSMNKMFTGVAVAQLAERGALSFDDALSRFLPDVPDREWSSRIRIEHLLTHTSGLGSYFNETFMESSRASFRTVDDMMELTRGDRPRFEPGTEWAYSNTGMLVLGAVIEAATGDDYFDYIRSHVYGPAGMTNSDSYDLDRVNPNLAIGYEREEVDGTVEYRNNIFTHVIRGGPAGGGYSTVDDLHAFALALQDGTLVTPASFRLLTSPKPDLASPGYGYGFGVRVERGSVGHTGGFMGISSSLELYPASGYVCIVLSNLGGGSSAVAQKMQELVDRLAGGG